MDINFLQLNSILQNVTNHGKSAQISKEDISTLKELFQLSITEELKYKEVRLTYALYFYLILISNEKFSPQLLNSLPEEGKTKKDVQVDEITIASTYNGQYEGKLKTKNLDFEISLKMDKVLGFLRNWESSTYLPESFILTKRSSESLFNPSFKVFELETKENEESSVSSFEEGELLETTSIPFLKSFDEEEEEDDYDESSSSCSMEESDINKPTHPSLKEEDPNNKESKTNLKEKRLDPQINKLTSNQFQSDDVKLPNKNTSTSETRQNKYFPKKISAFAKYKIEKPQNKISTGIIVTPQLEKRKHFGTEPSSLKTRGKSYEHRRRKNLSIIKEEKNKINQKKKKEREISMKSSPLKAEKRKANLEILMNSPKIKKEKDPENKRGKSLNPCRKTNNMTLFIPKKNKIQFRIESEEQKSYDPLSPHSSRKDSIFKPRRKLSSKNNKDLLPLLEESSPFSSSRTPVIPKRKLSDNKNSPFSSSSNKGILKKIVYPFKKKKRISSKSLPKAMDIEFDLSDFQNCKMRKHNFYIKPFSDFKSRIKISGFKSARNEIRKKDINPRSTNGGIFFVKVKKEKYY